MWAFRILPSSVKFLWNSWEALMQKTHDYVTATVTLKSFFYSCFYKYIYIWQQMGSDKVCILIVLYGAKLDSCFCTRIVKFGGETQSPTFPPILCKFMFLKERGIQYHALLFVFYGTGISELATKTVPLCSVTWFKRTSACCYYFAKESRK